MAMVPFSAVRVRWNVTFACWMMMKMKLEDDGERVGKTQRAIPIRGVDELAACGSDGDGRGV